jgi:hypothetical protein
LTGSIRDAREGARIAPDESARWTAKDPLLFGGDGENLYAYVLLDPINQIDATGEGIVDCAKAIADYVRYKDKLNKRIAENLSCPDPGHDKAIEQLRNRVEQEEQRVRRHCKDPTTLAELGLIALGGLVFLPVEGGGLIFLFAL